MRTNYLAFMLVVSITLVLPGKSFASNLSPTKNESIQAFLDRTSTRHTCHQQKEDQAGVLTCPGGWKLWEQKADRYFPDGTCAAHALATMLLNSCGSSPEPSRIAYAIYGPLGASSMSRLETHAEWLAQKTSVCKGFKIDTDLLQKREILDPANDPDSMMRGMLYPRIGQPYSVQASTVIVNLRHPEGRGSGHATVVVAQTSTTIMHITWKYLYKTPAWAFHKLTDPSGAGRAVHIEKPSSPRP